MVAIIMEKCQNQIRLFEPSGLPRVGGVGGGLGQFAKGIPYILRGKCFRTLWRTIPQKDAYEDFKVKFSPGSQKFLGDDLLHHIKKVKSRKMQLNDIETTVNNRFQSNYWFQLLTNTVSYTIANEAIFTHTVVWPFSVYAPCVFMTTMQSWWCTFIYVWKQRQNLF